MKPILIIPQNSQQAHRIQENVHHPVLPLVWKKGKANREVRLVFFVKGFETLGTDICFGFYLDGYDAVIFLNEEILLEGGLFASVL